eukprot:maker-scaffold_35-snap-gene-2.92-mRNA-1 protein AED:0.00 eAED:0.00 QI:14/1/1/1/1/1/2/98/555
MLQLQRDITVETEFVILKKISVMEAYDYDSDQESQAQLPGRKSAPKCDECGSKNITNHHLMGLICSSCGNVLDDSLISNAMTFSKNADGSSAMNGHLVSHYSHAPINKEGENIPLTTSYREMTLIKGKRDLQTLAQDVNLGSKSADLVEKAFKLYSFAVLRMFLRGRNKRHVQASCLYIVCRKNKIPRFMLDFCVVLRISPFKFHTVYTALRNLLEIKIPPIKLSLYVEKYITEMNFAQADPSKTVGNKKDEQFSKQIVKGNVEMKIAKTAKKILKVLQGNWMSEGRKPQALIGTAILQAGRIHGFSVEEEQVMETFKVSRGTLHARMKEFQDSDAAKLTVKQFMQGEVENSALPPALKEKIDIREKEDPEYFRQIENDLKFGMEKVKGLNITSIEDVDADDEESEEIALHLGDDVEVLINGDVDDGLAEVDVDEEDEDEDQELDNILLDEEEAKTKTAVWDSLHKNYYEQQEKARKLREEQGAAVQHRSSKLRKLDLSDYNFDDVETERMRSKKSDFLDEARRATKKLGTLFDAGKQSDLDKLERLLTVPLENM